jgi:dipeptidyl aminopeptidase/acylaminoacyl peptidase
MQGTSDIPEENALVHWNRPFYDHMDLYWERSPLAHVRDCHTPLLILHGEKDARVPIGQATELYTALRLLGRDVEYVRYPREGHGLREAAHQADALQRSLDWFDRYLQPGAAGVTTRR